MGFLGGIAGAVIMFAFFWLWGLAFLPEDTYAVSDLNQDGEVDLTDWSIFNANYPYGN